MLAVLPFTLPLTQQLDDTQVSPGIAGFLVMFGLALATVLLVRSMVGHLRKVRYSPEPGQGGSTPPGEGDRRAAPQDGHPVKDGDDGGREGPPT